MNRPHPSQHRTSRLLAPSLGLLLSLAALPTAAAPQRLVCNQGSNQFSISLDATGAPSAVAAQVVAGTRDCALRSVGKPVAAAPGWRFDWQDEDVGTRYTASLTAAGPGAYQLSLSPAQCGALALPAQAKLDPKAPGCRTEADREGAFSEFWQALRGALARGDGPALQALAEPKVAFLEGPDEVAAPARLLAQGLRCLPTVPLAGKPGQSLAAVLAQQPGLQLADPLLQLSGKSEASIGGALGLRWTGQAWRISWVNASRSVLAECK